MRSDRLIFAPQSDPSPAGTAGTGMSEGEGLSGWERSISTSPNKGCAVCCLPGGVSAASLWRLRRNLSSRRSSRVGKFNSSIELARSLPPCPPRLAVPLACSSSSGTTYSPLGIMAPSSCAPSRSARSHLALSKLAPRKLASLRLISVRLASRKSAPLRSMPTQEALRRLACFKLVARRSAPLSSAPSKLARTSRADSKLAPSRLAPTKTALLRSTRTKFAPASWASRKLIPHRSA